ncbi:hydroxypyruvate isomerase family protein [candidate division KSB1 bacterium]
MIERRTFLKKTSMALTGAVSLSSVATYSPQEKHTFKLKYAPHFGLASHIKNQLDRLDYFASFGFKAFELNGLTNWTFKDTEGLSNRMKKLNMEMGVFTANPNGWDNTRMIDPAQREAFLKEIKRSMEYVKIIGNKFVTVLAGNMIPKLTRAQMAVNMIESLRYAADIAGKHNVTLCVEPLNVLVNHPGYFLNRSDEAYEMLIGVNHPHAKMLFDVYHQQITEGNLINNIRQFHDKIGTFHIGDNPGRQEPGTGEINYRNVFKAIFEIKHPGFIGMEFSPSIKEQPEGFEKVVNEIIAADNF